MQVEIVNAGKAGQGRFTSQIPDLIYATGPISYGYQFGAGRRVLNAIVEKSWQAPQTLFSAEACTLALSDGELLGMELGFHGPDFYVFKSNLVALAPVLIDAGALTYEELAGLGERAQKASYLNAHLLDGVYYLFALAVREEYRGQGIGAQLLTDAIVRARAAGFKELQLDVLSDNPAVRFYRSMGLEVVVEIRSPELSRDHAFPSEYRMSIAL